MRVMAGLAVVACLASIYTALATTQRGLRRLEREQASLARDVHALRARGLPGREAVARPAAAAPPALGAVAAPSGEADPAALEEPPADPTWSGFSRSGGRKALIARFDTPSEVSRLRAIEDVSLFARMGDAGARQTLFDALEDPDSDVRMQAVEAVARLGDAEAIENLSKLVGDAEVDVRLELAKELGSSDSPAAGPVLKNLLDDPSAWVVEEALKSLRDQAYAPAHRDILRLSESSEPKIAGAAGQALNSIGDRRGAEQVIERLVPLTRSEDPQERYGAIKQIYNIDFASAEPHLLRALEDPDPEIREKAGWLLENPQ